jgi:hypothetical protein
MSDEVPCFDGCISRVSNNLTTMAFSTEHVLAEPKSFCNPTFHSCEHLWFGLIPMLDAMFLSMCVYTQLLDSAVCGGGTTGRDQRDPASPEDGPDYAVH